MASLYMALRGQTEKRWEVDGRRETNSLAYSSGVK